MALVKNCPACHADFPGGQFDLPAFQAITCGSCGQTFQLRPDLRWGRADGTGLAEVNDPRTFAGQEAAQKLRK